MALRDHLLSQDLIYVGGGSMVNLLAVWEAHDIASILSLAWRQGIVLAGQRAGAMCWFEAGITKSSGKPLEAAGLGLLHGSLCVHYNNEPERRAAYLEAVGDGMPAGYGLDDYAGLLWEGEDSPSAVTARRGARAYRVSKRDDEVVESPLPGPLPPRPGPGRPARGHRRVPPDQDDAAPGGLAGAAQPSSAAGGAVGSLPSAPRFSRAMNSSASSRLSRERSTTFSRSSISETSSTCSLMNHWRNCSAR